MADAARPLVAFWGKELDHCGNALAMLLASAGHDAVPHVYCLTGRPATLRVPVHRHREWLTPVVPAWRAIERGLRLCGIRFRSWVLEGAVEQRQKQLQRAWQETKGRPLLCGPLNPARLWNRYESRYSSLPTHFVLIVEIDRRGDAMLHDPEGMAFLERPLSLLLGELQAPEQPSLFAIDPDSSPLPPLALFEQAFRQVINLRVENLGRASSAAAGLRQLADVVRLGPLTGSRMEAARIGLSFAGRCAAWLSDLAEDNGARSVQTVLGEYGRAAALAQESLIGLETDAAGQALMHLADEEDALDRLIVSYFDGAPGDC